MDYEKSICHLRWGYPNISLSRGEIRTCCKTPFQRVSRNDMLKYDVNLFLNSSYQKERRLEMLKGIRHKDCNSCWQIEDQGATSLRGNSPKGFIDFARRNNMFDEFPGKSISEISKVVTLENAILESHRPFMLEVSLGNTCDMKCMYCNHIYSSQWAVEDLKNKKISVEQYKNSISKYDPEFINLFWKWVNQEAKFSVNRIGIIGGEPLITPEFYDFLDRLLETYSDIPHNKTNIWIVTNMNCEENYFNKFLEFIPKLNKKFHLEIHISMESLNKQAEYIRNGLNWERFEKNVNKIFNFSQNIDNITLAFLPSVNALSVPRFSDFLKWIYNLSTTYKKPVMLKQNIVTWPSHHTPFILPDYYSKYLDPAIDFLSETENSMPEFPDLFGRWVEYKKFLINLRNSIHNGGEGKTELRKQFAEWVDHFDNLRGLNFKETFPELENFYNKCK